MAERWTLVLMPATTSLPCPGALILRSIIIEWFWDKTDMRYSDEAHLYCSAQPSVFSHIVINFDISFWFFNNSIKQFLCEVVVSAYCLPSSEKIKHCMLRTWFCGCVYFCIWLCNVIFQYNTLNRHGSISTIIFWFYLLGKNSNHPLSIITAT